MRAPVKYDNPPVVEVVCGVLFASPGPIEAVHIGALWERLKSDFPQVSDAPPLAPVIESEGNSVTEIAWTELPPLRRSFFASVDGTSLIQIQQDRFLYNWKRTIDQDSYPSYEEVVKNFERYLAVLTGFLDELGTSRPVIRQLELTYVNFVTESNGLRRVGTNSMFVDHVRSDTAGRFLPEPDGFNWSTTYALPNGEGRMHIVSQSAINPHSAEKIVRLDLIARGMPPDQSPCSMRSWFDTAHEWITQGFADTTSQVLQVEAWGRIS